MTPCLAAEAARILGVTPATVRLMESRGELPATRTESGVRIFDRADVERLAAERSVSKAKLESAPSRRADEAV